MNKTLYLGLPNQLSYYLMLEYLKKNKEWVQGCRYPHIAFSESFETFIREDEQSSFKYFASINNFYSFMYNYKNFDVFTNSIAGYENIVIGNAFIDFPDDSDNYHVELRKLITKLGKDAHRIYVILPDLIFKPNDDYIYKCEDFSNNDMTYRTTAYYSFLDNYIRFLRNFHKHSVYRIVVPQVIQHQNLGRFCKIDYRMTDNKELKHPTSYIRRNTLTYKQLAEALYKVHEESFPKNYMIGTGNQSLLNLNDIVGYKLLHTDNRVNESIMMEDNFIKFENGDIMSVIKNIQRNIKLQNGRDRFNNKVVL